MRRTARSKAPKAAPPSTRLVKRRRALTARQIEALAERHAETLRRLARR